MTKATKALRLYARESLQFQNRRDNLTDLFGDDCVEITEAAGEEGRGEIFDESRGTRGNACGSPLERY